MTAARPTRAARLNAAARAARQVRDWTDRRDDRIRALVADGVPQREVARTVGLSHTAVQYICRTAPPPAP